MRAVGAALACVAALAPSSAGAGLFDDEVARKQIVELRQQLNELRQQQSLVAERVAKVEEALKSQPNQPVLALVSQIEALREELRQLRGQLEVVNHNVEMASKRQRDMYVDLDTRLRRLEQPAATAGASPPPAPGLASAAPPTLPGAPAASAAIPGDEQRAYEAAHGLRRSGDYKGAIAAFQSFIAQYPKSVLAPRAQYWIGDSYYNLRDYRNAVASQEKLISTYPDSSSVPDALLNIASSQIELGDTAAAKKTMDGIVARYPTSEAAEKARRRLATLK